MTRCVAASLSAAALFALAAAAPPAAAQVHRNFPQKALRGAIAFETPPAIQLNGNEARMSPGVRIHGMDNMLKMSGSLAGTKYVVDYTVEALGLVSEIWLLTPDEAAVRPWPTTPAQAANWHFDPIAQAWTIP
jgi:hypothetical protein